MPGQRLSRESGHPRSHVHTPSGMDSPEMERPCCTKGVHVFSMLRQCLYNAENHKDPGKTCISRDGMVEDLSMVFLVVIADLLSIVLGGLQR